MHPTDERWVEDFSRRNGVQREVALKVLEVIRERRCSFFQIPKDVAERLMMEQGVRLGSPPSGVVK